MLQGSHF